MAQKYETPIHEAAEQLLAEIAATSGKLEEKVALANAALLEVEGHWGRELALLRERLGKLAAALKDLEKEHKEVFWPGAGFGSWSIKLPGGGKLLYSQAEHVVKGRQVLRLAQLYGFEEVLRRTVAVDWEVLADKQEWPDEALAVLGAHRKTEELFDYEIVGAASSRPGRVEPAPTEKESVGRESAAHPAVKGGK
jgi:hypothetical protein